MTRRSMSRLARRVLRRALPGPVFARLKMAQRRVQFARSSGFSDEEALIHRYLESLPVRNRYCVDIAAQDGIGGSQTLGLFKAGWQGLAVELDPHAFAVLAGLYRGLDGVALARTKVTPDNVCDLLRANGCPTDLGFLSLDIDSYDYFVLDAILSEFRPTLICTEINEAIPPPIRFAVRYHADHAWDGSHFQGQSLAQCGLLCEKYRYEIVALHYNNLLLVCEELNAYPALSVESAYAAGYRNRPDRLDRFPQNRDLEGLLTMSRSDGVDLLRRRFARFEGRFELE